MLKYDTLVIGGGLAGYCAAIRACELGKKTLLITQGESSLQFASGSIDLMYKHPENNEIVASPFDAIQTLSLECPHPYRKIGVTAVSDAMTWFQKMMRKQDVFFQHTKNHLNHQRITPFGTLKTTWLSQDQSFMLEQDKAFNYERILVIDIHGFRDFQPEIMIENLRKVARFSHLPILKKVITFPEQCSKPDPLAREKRSMDYARQMETPSCFDAIANQIVRLSTEHDFIILPSVFSECPELNLMADLAEKTQRHFHEVPTIPPSLMGIRIAKALEKQFIQVGGSLMKTTSVIGGHWQEKAETGSLSLKGIHTDQMSDFPIYADNFILSSGRFFNKGLSANRDGITETIFQLDIENPDDRAQWANSHFFESHPLMRSGVRTDARFRPFKKGKIVENLYCVGGVLSGFDAIKEGNAGGIAISSAYFSMMNLTQTDVNSNKENA